MFKELFRRCTKQESISANQENDVSKIARTVVLIYLQSWGQPLQEKINALNNAVRCAKIKAHFVQKMDGNKVILSGWESHKEKDLKRAKCFLQEIGKCFPTGAFETEVCNVTAVIKKYRRKEDLK